MSSTVSTPNVFRTKHGECAKLTTTNYAQWAMAMVFILKGENLWEIVLGVEVPLSVNSSSDNSGTRSTRSGGGNGTIVNQQPGTPHSSDYQVQANCAASTIFSSLTVRVQPYLGAAKDPKAMWDALEQRFDTVSTQSGAIQLRMKFLNDSLKLGAESVSDFIARLISYQTQLVNTDEALSDRAVVSQILYPLPDQYAGINRHITDKPSDQQTIEYVLDTLLEFERTNTTLDSSMVNKADPQAFFVRRPNHLPTRSTQSSRGAHQGRSKPFAN